MKKVISVLVVICLVMSLSGCGFVEDVTDSIKAETPKTFEFDGVSIELTNKFLRMDFMSEESDFVVGNEFLTVMGHKTTDIEDYMSVLEYAKLYREVLVEYQGIDAAEITELDGIPTTRYTQTNEDGEEMSLAIMFYKGSDCFWEVYFGATDEEFDGLYDDICKYAKTVKCE